MRSVLVLLLLSSAIPSSPEQANPINVISAAEGSSKRRGPSHGILQECSFEVGSVFLISSMTTLGEQGWLLCFNSTSKRGWLYRIPWMIELYPEPFQSSISLALASKEQSDGRKYTFEGEISERELKGSLVVRDPLTKPQSQTYAVKGFKLNQLSSKIGRFPSGRFSNSRYIEEAGDVVGAELVLFFTGGQNAGLIKFNESYWGEPVFMPLALSNIRIISSQKIEFELRLGDEGTGKYTMTRHGDAMILKRLDVPTVPGSECKLLKEPRLLPEGSFH